MLRTERFSMQLFETKGQVLEYGRMYNTVGNRSDLDHNEMSSFFKRVAMFETDTYWNKDMGLLRILDETDTFVGIIGYNRLSEYEMNLGYRLLVPDARGKGIMSECVPVFVDHLFDSVPGLERVSLKTADDNIPSQKLALKSGFVYEGTLRKAYFYRGEMHDFKVYSIIKEDWMKK